MDSLRIGMITLIIFATISFSRQISGSFWTNYAMLRLLNTQPCDPKWFLCMDRNPKPNQTFQEGNLNELRSVYNLLQTAAGRKPYSQIIQLYAANILFALGERQQAADILESTISQKFHNRLLSENTYQGQLIKARQYVRSEEWEEAVRAFRLGLAWGGDDTLPIDEQDYFNALATYYQKISVTGLMDGHRSCLIGKYLVKANRLEQAKQWLDYALDQDDLSREDTAWCYYYLGQAFQERGNTDRAIHAYQLSIDSNPELRFSYFELINLLKQSQNIIDLNLVNRLIILGPQYYLGTQSDDFNHITPIRVNNGWTLVGYDLDDELLEEAHSIDVLLWWRSDGDGNSSLLDGDFIAVGDYWVERQRIINLFPNAGFQWGVDERNIPLGHDREYYGAPEGSLEIQEADRMGRTTHVLRANNTPNNQYIALTSRSIPVVADSYYLIGGWIWAQDRPGKMGWNCRGENFGQETAYYIATYMDIRPVEKWIHVSSLTPPFPGRYPEWCDILVTSINSQGGVMFDNILWAQITPP